MPAPRRLLRRLDVLGLEQQNTSSIARGELLYGAVRLGERGDLLLERIKHTVVPEIHVLPFDVAEAREYAWLRAVLERDGRVIGDPDTRIAATALVHDLTLVTANTRHFERVPGLRVENWLEEG